MIGEPVHTEHYILVYNASAGSLIIKPYVMYRNVNDNTFNIYGGQDFGYGANLALRGMNHSDNGFFTLNANDGTINSSLVGRPNGRLTWNGLDLSGSAIESKNIYHNGYIKFACGLIIQWTYNNRSSLSTTSVKEYSYPINFGIVTAFCQGISSSNSEGRMASALDICFVDLPYAGDNRSSYKIQAIGNTIPAIYSMLFIGYI